MKLCKVGSAVIVAASLVVSGAVFADSFFMPAYNGELVIDNKSNAVFKFLGSCNGGQISHTGNATLQPGQSVTFQISGAGDKGEIGYADLTHNKYFNFVYDYTKPGGDVTVAGDKTYYRFVGVCTLKGNEVFIENK